MSKKFILEVPLAPQAQTKRNDGEFLSVILWEAAEQLRSMYRTVDFRTYDGPRQGIQHPSLGGIPGSWHVVAEGDDPSNGLIEVEAQGLSEMDQAQLVQIDTNEDGFHLRVFLNDLCIFDGRPGVDSMLDARAVAEEGETERAPGPWFALETDEESTLYGTVHLDTCGHLSSAEPVGDNWKMGVASLGVRWEDAVDSGLVRPARCVPAEHRRIGRL